MKRKTTPSKTRTRRPMTRLQLSAIAGGTQIDPPSLQLNAGSEDSCIPELAGVCVLA